MQPLLVAVVLAPGVLFLALSLAWMLGWTAGEGRVAHLTAVTFLGCGLGIAALAWPVVVHHARPVTVDLGDWFTVAGYRFPLRLLADRLGLAFLGMTALLAGLIGRFSATYLHREPGYFRFFVLLQLFAFGSLLAFAAGSFDLLLAGWEIVGITSVLLIGFFHLRPAPVENGLYVFAVYRACDIGLLLAIFALHHWTGGAPLGAALARLSGPQALAVSLLLTLAAAGKAAQVPFSGWLPRAMEGPTPSSAIFYGAISIHAGVYLLLRIRPWLAQSPPAAALVILVGAATALHGTLAGRVSADAKTGLAYASLSQVGLMFVEIGCGWTTLATLHALGHALVRTLQFLRAPSQLHDDHRMRAAIGGAGVAAPPPEELLPERFRLWLYRWAFDRGHLDTVLDRGLAAPLVGLARLLARLDRAAPEAGE